MQTLGSVESTTSGSSAEPLVVHRALCPVRHEGPLVLEEPLSVLQLAALTPEEFAERVGRGGEEGAPVPAALASAQDELKTMGRTSAKRLDFLQDRLDELRRWIQEAFGVSDVHAWMETHQSHVKAAAGVQENDEGHKKPNMAAEGAPTRGADGPQNAKRGEKSRAGLAEEAKAVLPLRIKLVDDKAKTSASAPSQQHPRSGTGSKNLSRMMSRPSEATAETKAKIPNQTLVSVFWNYVEPFFKPIDENDIKSLEDSARILDPAPFTIPPLGKHYEEQWREQYDYSCSHLSMGRRGYANSAFGGEGASSRGARSVTLKERLLAMLIEENLSVAEAADGAQSPSEGTANETDACQASSSPSPPPPLPEPGRFADFVHVDERIRQELSESGLFIFVPQVDYQEDDSICAEMRTLQKRLREQICLNHYRKRKLADVVRRRLPAQEFYSLLGDIDKQIEQSFVRRVRVQKKRKKGSSTGSSPSPAGAQGVESVPLVETRRRLIESFSSLIPTQPDFLSSTTCALFSAECETEVLRYARESGSWLPIPEQALHHVRLAKNASRPVFPSIDGSLGASAPTGDPVP